MFSAFDFPLCNAIWQPNFQVLTLRVKSQRLILGRYVLEQVQRLCDMGFTPTLAAAALREHNGDMDAAVASLAV
eukprot:1409085-Rhodomonas_salina.2